MNAYGTKYISKKDFDLWVELVKGDQYGPSYADSKIRVSGKLPSGVEFRLNATAILVTKEGNLYGRYDSYNAVKVSCYHGSAMNLFGHGARAVETWDEAQSLLDLLTGENYYQH